jgi:DNA-binding LacI/PurR family transcriptional regulator
VETAIKDLGYQPNLKARSMRNSKSGYIGVLLPNITDNIYVRIYNGVERIASKNGYIIALHISNGSPEIEENLLSRM